MPKGYSRLSRVSDLIQTTLAEILRRETEELHVGMITITDVKMSPDLSFAKVYVSVLEDEKAKETIDTLNESTKAIRYQLAHAVKLRITPDLKFYYDDSTLRGNRISSLINKALKNKNDE